MPEMTSKEAAKRINAYIAATDADGTPWIAALRLAVRALEPWRTTMDGAPRDRTPILALMKAELPDSYCSGYQGRYLVLRWMAGEDGWSLPGVGGIPDSWIEKWMEIPG